MKVTGRCDSEILMMYMYFSFLSFLAVDNVKVKVRVLTL